MAAAALILAGVGVAFQQRGSDSGSDDDFASAEAEAEAETEADADSEEAEVTRSADSALAMDEADDSGERVEGDEESSGAAADTGTLMARSLTFAELPDAEEALALAEEMGLVPPAPDGTAFDASGCGEVLAADEAPTAVVRIDVAGDALELYVFGGLGAYRSYLVLPSCEIIDQAP